MTYRVNDHCTRRLGLGIGQPNSFMVPAWRNMKAATILSMLCRYDAMDYSFSVLLPECRSREDPFD